MGNCSQRRRGTQAAERSRLALNPLLLIDPSGSPPRRIAARRHPKAGIPTAERLTCLILTCLILTCLIMLRNDGGFLFAVKQSERVSNESSPNR
jgi:hypothetical protein